MKTDRLSHRLALLLVGLTILLTAAGSVEAVVKPGFHAMLGGLVFLLVATLAWRLRSRASLAASLFAAAGGLRLIDSGWLAPAQIVHAVLAQGLLAASFLVALETSARWHEVSPLEDGGWPSLRQLAWLTPAVTLLQISLGAAFRHKAIGIVPHVSWAFATAICVMTAGTYVLTQQGSGILLRRVSITLLVLTGIQVLLGVAAYLARINSTVGALGPAPAAHITTGSLVMAFSCVWSAIVWRDTNPAADTLPLNSGHHS